MSMTLIGTFKNGGVYEVNGKDNSKKPMISFTMVDALGNSFPCQMWPDDPGFSNLSALIPDLRRKQLQLTVAGYTVRMREFNENGRKVTKPWANFIVTDVVQPSGENLLSMYFTGTVKAGAVNRGDGTKKQMIWFSAVDEVGTTFPCQVWQDDPQFAELAPVFDQGVRRHQVQFLVANYTLRMRKFQDGHEAPQINFVVSDVAFPALAHA